MDRLYVTGKHHRAIGWLDLVTGKRVLNSPARAELFERAVAEWQSTHREASPGPDASARRVEGGSPGDNDFFKERGAPLVDRPAAADTGIDIEDLFKRASTATSAEGRANCLREIDSLLPRASGPAERGRLLMCRARVYSNGWETAKVVEDARAATELFEEVGETALMLDAASLTAAHASRLGALSLAIEMATKSILGLDSVNDDRLLVEVTNRLGMVCYSFLNYDRAVKQFELGLAAAERCGDRAKVYRQLHNIADALLLAASRDREVAEGTVNEDNSRRYERLERAERVVQRLLAEGTPEMQRRSGSQRLRAELLVESGRAREAMQILEGTTDDTSIVQVAQRAALARVKARCLRALGRVDEALEMAERAVEIAEDSGDDIELMLSLDERLVAREATGDSQAALADAREVKRRMWSLHARQTAQLVEEVWTRADLERERSQLITQTAVAMHSAEEDALTGVGNRRLLERFLDHADLGSSTVVVIVADIDHFKMVNDTFGHEIGDRVLVTLGRLFTPEARSHQVVVRFGGDEFVFALLNCEMEMARVLAERIRLSVESHTWDDLNERLHVTISLGVARGLAKAWKSILVDADRSLYAAKRGGRNQVVCG